MSENLVQIENLAKDFKNLRVLQDINAVFPKGKMIALAGPDGSGKTTLIRLIAGLLLPTLGKITVADFDTVDSAENIHELIGYMPQRFGLYEDLTVMQNLILYADLKGVVGDERKKVFEKLLAFTTLTPFKERLAKNLSGGMKQKLGLACTLISKPKLLLLDEPSVGVDPISRRELWKMVQELLNEGITVVWSTAYLDEAEKCDSVLLLNEGKLLYHGSASELTKRVTGRVFKIKNILGNKRALLFHILKQENVMDAVIQGSEIRILTKEGAVLDLASFEGVECVASEPRFEDAFIDILGGCPKRDSKLAQNFSQIASKKEFIIETEGLTKKFGAFTAADNINLKIKCGEVFGLLGPNGAGKSTTFKMLCPLLQPTSGKAIVNGYDLQVAPAEARAHIGYMAQKFSLYSGLSVKQNLDFFAGVYNLQNKKRQEMIEQMVQIFNFREYLSLPAGLLSLGYKQRLALACALMHHPEVLFLDEPTSGVDPITRREFWGHINGLVEKGTTVMITTHFMDEAQYCDRIGLIYQSKLITIGTPDSLKEMAKTLENPSPTLEDAFIHLIKEFDKKA